MSQGKRKCFNASLYNNQVSIWGSGNSIYGNRCIVYGDTNTIYGDRCKVYGNYTTVYGNRCHVYGKGITDYGNRTKCHSAVPASKIPQYTSDSDSDSDSNIDEHVVFERGMEYFPPGPQSVGVNGSNTVVVYSRGGETVPEEDPMETIKDKQSEKLADEADDDQACCVCSENKKTVCFVPCGHVCCCPDCTKRLAGNGNAKPECPICRREITKAVYVFI